MDRVKNVTKGGWHPPGKDGGKESWRGDFKGIGQVAGWMGKGKESHVAPKEHTSRPLASLKDPDAFGPPPKNVNYHGGAAVPNATTPDRRGMGAPLAAEEIHTRQDHIRQDHTRQVLERNEEEDARKPAPPPIPYRADRTGLTTTNLPKPPIRRLDDGSRSPAPSLPTKAKPSLPPRLPPRQNSHPTETAPSPPPTYNAATQQPHEENYINQSAVSRLGSVGVSVPGLGINRTSSSSSPSNPWHDQPSSTNPPSTSSTNPPATSPLSSMQSRFSSLNTTSPTPSPPPPTTTNGGTTLAQKQSALQTASAFHSDPSSISLSDARATASTANNFHARHADQVASGWKTGAALNKKYGVADKMGGFAGNASPAATTVDPASPASSSSTSGRFGALGQHAAAGFQKAAPPPVGARPPGVASPPPVPLSSKPRG